jgi:hypothetical protein
MRLPAALLIIVVVLLGGTAAAQAATITVGTNADVPASQCTLRDVIATSAAGQAGPVASKRFRVLRHHRG